ncbi:ion channel [Taklimakanibacter lacteus]|uniref:ion channel n=1 Tax=Taklimakanibacter lacteus TaxID=2268456 RepID=UPI000E665761
MLFNLAVGTAVILTTILIHTAGLIGITHAMTWLVGRFRMHGRRSRVVAIVTVVLGLFTVLTVEVWLWAICYLLVGAFNDLETGLYFSTVTFSTLGFGDVLPPERWRLLSALEAVNGFLVIGWSTAYLVAASTRVGPFRSGEHF